MEKYHLSFNEMQGAVCDSCATPLNDPKRWPIYACPIVVQCNWIVCSQCISVSNVPNLDKVDAIGPETSVSIGVVAELISIGATAGPPRSKVQQTPGVKSAKLISLQEKFAKIDSDNNGFISVRMIVLQIYFDAMCY
jgi:hypothetical protein